jgi:hypothetical protein
MWLSVLTFEERAKLEQLEMKKATILYKSEVITILSTEEDIYHYPLMHGTNKIELTQEHIQALQDGKTLGWNDSEYATLISFKKE